MYSVYVLISDKDFESRAETMRFEKFLKSGSGHADLKDLIGRYGPQISRSDDHKADLGLNSTRNHV